MAGRGGSCAASKPCSARCSPLLVGQPWSSRSPDAFRSPPRHRRPSRRARARPRAKPTLNLQGTASDNLAYFDYVNKNFIDEGGDLSGRPFIDNLVKAGFPKVDMEVTPDRTTVNLAADNISFSVRLGKTCLIGQYGNTGYASTAQKLLSHRSLPDRHHAQDRLVAALAAVR